MSYAEEEWFRRTVDLAAVAHAGQVDGCGEPYIDHLTRTVGHLIRLVPDATREEIEAALVHDIFEDTAATEAELLVGGVTPDAIAIARQVTKPADVTGFQAYRAWIAGLAQRGTDSAIRVKLADSADNLDPRRVAKSNGITRAACRYEPAKAILEGEIAWRRNGSPGRILRHAQPLQRCLGVHTPDHRLASRLKQRPPFNCHVHVVFARNDHWVHHGGGVLIRTELHQGRGRRRDRRSTKIGRLK